MAVKKGTHKKKEADDKIKNIPDIFEDDGEKSSSSNASPIVVEVEETNVTINEVVIPSSSSSETEEENESADLPAPFLPPPVEISIDSEESLEEIPEEAADLPAPSFIPEPQVQPKAEEKKEQSLPKFFSEDLRIPDEMPNQPKINPPQQPDPMVQKATQILEKTVPQAFVGELNEVRDEVKGEKRNLLVTFFIIAGMVLVAAGIVGTYLFIVNKPGSSGTNSNPTPANPVVETTTPSATATPTPKPSASPSADLETLKKKTKVNVLNGTKIVGLAAKQAAALKKAGYITGTVGNGDPNQAGTITVPTGSLILGQDIQETLSTFTFTVKESATAKDATVVLDTPKE
jgi:hypothetical protein